MCSLNQVLLLYLSYSVDDLGFSVFHVFICVCTGFASHEKKMNQHYIPSLSKGLFLGIYLLDVFCSYGAVIVEIDFLFKPCIV